MNFRHDAALTMATSIAVIVTGLLTWAICHWWYGRRILAAAHRQQKSEKERAFAREQTVQARLQLEQLKTELASQQRVTTESQAVARQRTTRLEDERRAAAKRLAASDSGFMPIVAGHGFADTQILPE